MDKSGKQVICDKTQTEKSGVAVNQFEIAVMLAVNEKLYQKGKITEEMYFRAKERIITI